ncbi:hypothetical protein AB0A74_01180 [Saccharothrix sp. NPDC042600]|uniref:hypothetical protein n=1 Tax=Saccharothrix TaxID=2071 RepID=UPI0033F22A07|nr:hypothetical protein GCM10017745_49440 [Saccharothrix mutabilis subsp. capreolus]
MQTSGRDRHEHHQGVGGAPAELPQGVERLLRRWEHRSRRFGWVEGTAWRSPEAEAVADALLSGSGVEEALVAFGDQRARIGVGEAGLRSDLEALTDVLADQQGRPSGLAAFLLPATRGMRAAAAAAVLESALVDPVTGFAAPAGFAAALWASARGRVGPYRELRTYRWTASRGAWRTLAARMDIAAALRPWVGPEDAAVFVDPAALAVVLVDSTRFAELEEVLGDRVGAPLADAQVHPIPPCDSLRDLITWLLGVCPQLVGTTLEARRG